jgi:hypothetical protein
LEETSGLCGKRTLPPLALDHGYAVHADICGKRRGLGLWGSVAGLAGCCQKTGSRVKPGMTQLWGLVWCVLGFVVVFKLNACPYSVLLIRVNLCNLWMIILKDWIPGQARDDTALGSGVVCFGVCGSV